MFGGAALMVAALPWLAAAVRAFSLGRHVLAATWLSAGGGCSAILTPPGRLLRSVRPPPDRPKPLAAQFALSHADWLAIHPAPCSLMTAHGVVPAMPGLACAARSPCSRSGGCGPQSIPLAQAARTPPHHAIRPHAATRARRASPSLPRRTSPKDHDHSPGSRFAFPTAVGYSGG
jgi:hypothetical protein